jgi:hypothetical protein
VRAVTNNGTNADIALRNSGVLCTEARAIEHAGNDVPSAADRTGARRRPIHGGSIDGRTADRCKVARLQASIGMTALRLARGPRGEARVEGTRVAGYEGRANRVRRRAMLARRMHSGRRRGG